MSGVTGRSEIKCTNPFCSEGQTEQGSCLRCGGTGLMPVVQTSKERARVLAKQIYLGLDPRYPDRWYDHIVSVLTSNAPETGAVIIGWMVGDPLQNPAMYNLAQYDEASDAACRWNRPITALVQAPNTPNFAPRPSQKALEQSLRGVVSESQRRVAALANAYIPPDDQPAESEV